MATAVLWQGLGTAIIGEAVPPELSTFTTFTAFLTAAVAASTVYFCGRAKLRGVTYQPVRLSLRDIMGINILTAGAFGAFYIAATLIAPTAASVIETGLGPVIVSIILMFGTTTERAPLKQPLVVMALSAALAGLVLNTSGKPSEHAILGVALSLLAGCCAAGVLLSSSRLAARGITALQISAVRFHLAWVISGLLTLSNASRFLDGDPEKLIYSAIVGATCIAAPILLLQWGITIAQPGHSALIISVLPAVVLIGELALGAPAQPLLIIGMTALASVSLLGALRRL